MLLSPKSMGVAGVLICLEASFIARPKAAEAPPASPPPSSRSAGERLEFSGSGNAAVLPPGSQDKGWRELNSLSPGNSLGAVLSRSSGIAAPSSLAAPPPSRNTPRVSRRDRNWAATEANETDPDRAAEIAAGVRDPNAYFRALGADYGKRGSAKSATAVGDQPRPSLEPDTAASTSLSMDYLTRQQTGSLDPILDRRAPRFNRSPLDGTLASGSPSPSFTGVPGLNQPPAPTESPAQISSSFQLRESLTPRSVRDLIGNPDASWDRTGNRSLFPIAGARDLTREEINPVKPQQPSSLDAILPEGRRRSSDPFASEYGLPPRSPYASSPSPLRELTSKLQGPSVPVPFQAPKPEPARPKPRSGPTELPTRSF